MIKNAKDVLSAHGFVFSKKFGQNFLSDKNLLAAIVCDAGITDQTDVLEIGPGAGALTAQLCKRAKKVVCYEIDKSLEGVLDEMLEDFDNKTIFFADALSLPEQEICKNFEGKFKLVANLPYYITTPLIFKFLPMQKTQSLTIMVQKEVAQRICAKANTPEYGALSVMCQFYADCKIARIVPRNMFYPVPKVDSAIVVMQKKDDANIKLVSNQFHNFVKAAFSCRRKTLANNLSIAYKLNKDFLGNLLQNNNIRPSVRAEQLSWQTLLKLCKEICEKT